MRFFMLIAIAALILAPATQAGGKISVSATYDGTYLDLTICGTGAKTVEIRVIHPDGSVQVGQLRTDFACADWNDAFPAPDSGTYTVEVGNLQGNNTYASTTVTVP